VKEKAIEDVKSAFKCYLEVALKNGLTIAKQDEAIKKSVV